MHPFTSRKATHLYVAIWLRVDDTYQFLGYAKEDSKNIPGDKKHEPSEVNYYTFGDELTPLGINSLSFP